MNAGSADQVASEPADGRPALRRWLATVPWSPSYGLAAAIVIAVVFLSVASPHFLSAQNFLNIGRAISITGIVAMTLTLLLIAGAIDLSVASVMSVAGVVVGHALEIGLSLWVALPAALLFGALAGLLNGALVNIVRINAIIVTVGTLFLWRGVSHVLAGRREPLIDEPVVLALGQARPLGIPMPLILLGITFVAVWLILFQTRLGAHFFALGGDRTASRLMGLPVARLGILGFVISGFAAAFAGVVLTGSIGVSLPYAAAGMELVIIAAVILGGTSLHGGRGSPVGTLLALIFLGVIFNGMTLLNIDAQWQLVVQGVVLLFAVTMDALRERAAER
jgi:ribose transport system permease protein